MAMSFQTLIRQLNNWAYASPNSPVRRWRRRRMSSFMRHVKPPPGARIVDLGGTRQLWDDFDNDLHVTIVNLPDSGTQGRDTARYRFVDGDACDLKEVFDDGEFDVVFSNSVIEHVGGEDRRRAFAAEVRRIARAYWIQTPSDRFPIEAHTGMPYYFSLPECVREPMHRRWQRDLPSWYEMIERTTVVSRKEMDKLFPDALVHTERLVGLEKSYTFYRPCAPIVVRC